MITTVSVVLLCLNSLAILTPWMPPPRPQITKLLHSLKTSGGRGAHFGSLLATSLSVAVLSPGRVNWPGVPEPHFLLSDLHSSGSNWKRLSSPAFPKWRYPQNDKNKSDSLKYRPEISAVNWLAVCPWKSVENLQCGQGSASKGWPRVLVTCSPSFC